MFIFQNEKYPAYASTLLNIQPYIFNPKTTPLELRGSISLSFFSSQWFLDNMEVQKYTVFPLHSPGWLFHPKTTPGNQMG